MLYQSKFRWVFYLLGFLFLSLGIIGAFLPILPTTPFLLLALYFFSKSSEKWSRWILEHNVFGPPIQRWKMKHAVTKKVKVTAILMLVLSFSISFIFIWGNIFIFTGLMIIFSTLLFFLLRLPVNDEPLTTSYVNHGEKKHG